MIVVLVSARGAQARGGEEIGDLAFQAGEAVCVGKAWVWVRVAVLG